MYRLYKAIHICRLHSLEKLALQLQGYMTTALDGSPGAFSVQKLIGRCRKPLKRLRNLLMFNICPRVFLKIAVQPANEPNKQASKPTNPANRPSSQPTNQLRQSTNKNSIAVRCFYWEAKGNHLKTSRSLIHIEKPVKLIPVEFLRNLC